MYRYEFTYSYMKPEVHVFKFVVDAFDDITAYYDALYEIARHTTMHATMSFEAPGEAKITCVKKGKVNGI